MEWRDSFANILRRIFGAEKTSLVARREKVSITLLGHPMGPREVTVIDELGAFGFFFGIEPEDDRNSLAPIGALGLGIEQAKVVRQMPFVVGADAVKLWGAIFDRRRRHVLLRIPQEHVERGRIYIKCRIGRTGLRT
jgi:hypothetical protein